MPLPAVHGVHLHQDVGRVGTHFRLSKIILNELIVEREAEMRDIDSFSVNLLDCSLGNLSDRFSFIDFRSVFPGISESVIFVEIFKRPVFWYEHLEHNVTSIVLETLD